MSRREGRHLAVLALWVPVCAAVLLGACRPPKDGGGKEKDARADAGGPEKGSGGPQAGSTDGSAPAQDPRDVLKGRVYSVTLDEKGGALFAGSAAGVVVYDVENLKEPSEVSVVHLPGSVVSIVQDGQRLYAAAGPDGVAVIDVGSLAEPRLLEMIGTPGAAWKAVPLGGSVLAVADGTMGVTLLDTAREPGERVLDRWETEDYVRDIALEKSAEGTFIYAAAGTQGLVLLEAVASGSLELRSVLACKGEVRNLFLAGQRVFAAAGEKGAAAAERKGRSLKKTWTFDPAAEDLVRGVWADAEKGELFLAAGEYGLVIADLSDPAGPRLAGRFDHDRALNRLVVRGDTAFVAADSAGLLILDVTDPANVKSW
jgi:hypothetical protein